MSVRIAANPVLTRELTQRLRGRRAWTVLTLYLAVLVGVLALIYQGESGPSDPFGTPDVLRANSVGQAMFEWVVFFMLLLVLFLVPGLTAGAIAGERDRQTMVPLQVSLLRPRSIVLGKLAASVAFLALLVVATLPILAVTYLIGGVTVLEVVQGLAAVLAAGLAMACLTIACSALARRSQSATVLAYGVMFVLVLGTFVAFGAAAAIDRSRGTDSANPPAATLLLNPIAGVADLLGSPENGLGLGSPFSGLRGLLHVDDRQGAQDSLGPGGFQVGDAVTSSSVDGTGFIGPDGAVALTSGTDEGFPFWAESALVLLGLSVVAIVVACRRVRTPAAIDR